MLRRRRGIAVAFCIVFASWVAARAADGPDDAPKPVGIPVDVVRASGAKVQGTFDPAAVRVKTEYGTVELDVHSVKQLVLEPAENGGPVTVSATLTTGDHLGGEFLADSIPVTIDGKVEPLKPGSDVQQITFRHPKHMSLLGAIVGLITLALMEVVLGVDNIIVLAIVSGKLPTEQQPKARRIGLLAALGTRLALLFTLTWLLGLTRPLFSLPDMPLFRSAEARGVSLRDLILLVGGTFLIFKSVKEMHEKLEAAKDDGGKPPTPKVASFWSVIVQIAVIDIVFSLDSVVTAVGMVDELWVMVGGMLIAVAVMMVASGPISRYVERHPTIKMLALSFLILIGVMLVAEGLGQHLDKGYIYFAMAFGVGVEAINMRLRPGAEQSTTEPASSG